jgi:hypothetical protein
MDMIEQLLLDYQMPMGDEATLRLRDGYAAVLEERAADVEARAIELLENGKAVNPRALFELLARSGSERGARYLQGVLLKGAEGISDAAGLLLTQSRYPGSAELLASCLADQHASVLVPTLMALRVSVRWPPCSALMPLLRHADATVRFHAVQASSDAGCLNGEMIDALAKDECDPSIRTVLDGLGREKRQPAFDHIDQRGSP